MTTCDHGNHTYCTEPCHCACHDQPAALREVGVNYFDKRTTNLPSWGVGVELYKWGARLEHRCLTINLWRTEWTWEWSSK